MLQYARAVHPIVDGVSYAEYLERFTTRLAVERAIEVVGEAARHISRPFQEAHPEVPWRKIIAMRHIIAHDYGELDHEAIWRVATTHIPELIAMIQPMIPPVEPDEPTDDAGTRA
ncbi:MAG: DUF86 domain-containing protein [Phycisphaerales bacterium]